MGEGKKVGETGPDDAGKNLEPTTVKVSTEICAAHLICLSFCKNTFILHHLTLFVYLYRNSSQSTCTIQQNTSLIVKLQYQRVC